MSNLKRLEALKAKRDGFIEQMENLTASAIDDQGEERAFTEEEQAKFEELEKNASALKKTIEAEERARELELKPVPAEEKKNEETATMTVEERAIAEERAFADFLRGVVSEERAGGDVNLTVTDGSATIPESIANKIISKVYDICPIAQMATRYTTKGTLQIPYYPASVTSGGTTTTPDITMAYVDEFVELEATSGKFTSIELQGFLSGVLTKISKSLINNNAFDIVGFVINKMAQNIARWLEGQLLCGTANKIRGLADAQQTLATAASAAVTGDELITLQDMVPDTYQANACWIMARSTRTAIRKLKDGQGNYLLEKDFTAKWGYKLLGKDVYVSDNMPAIGAGAKEIYYGDFSGLALKISEEVNITVLREHYAAQHALGVLGYLECDAKIEDEQKIAVLVGKAA